MFSSEDLVELLHQAWKKRMPLAHNWQNNPWPGQAASIRGWCGAQKPPVDWGAPQGYPVQTAQRAERAQSPSRIVAFQQPVGHRKIMFSLAQSENAQAFAAASMFARKHGFDLLP